MPLTKNVTLTLPATGNRTVILDTDEAGNQRIQYSVRDTSGGGHAATFALNAVLAAHPEIDAPTLAATLAIFRAYGDAQCGFSEV